MTVPDPETGLDRRSPILPAHIDETIRSIARLHADHHSATTRLQRSVARLVDVVGRPGFIALLSLAVAGWIGGNLLAAMAGRHPIDPPPFPWLELAVSLAALTITVLILTTQRRDDQLAQHREQLTLELAMLNEQKTAKIIALIEQLRQDSPLLHDRPDDAAAAMSAPADPQAILDAIKQSHAEAERDHSA